MARGTPHTPETKAAVMAALLAGQSVGEVAAQYHLSRSTVSAWRGEALARGSSGFEPKNARDLGGMIAEYLGEVLTTLAVQARAFRDEAWLKQQPASEVAVLHGVLADKAIRLLSALESDEQPGDGGQPVSD